MMIPTQRKIGLMMDEGRVPIVSVADPARLLLGMVQSDVCDAPSLRSSL